MFTVKALLSASRAEAITDVFFKRRIRSNSTMTNKQDINNLIGYMVTYLELSTFCIRKSIQPNAEVIDQLIDQYLVHSLQIYQGLNPIEQEWVRHAAPVEWSILLEKQEKLDRANADVEALRASASFRIGQKIVAIPHRLKQVLRSKSKA